MANGAATFAIDDQKTVDENLAAYLAEISAIDAELTAVLAPKLGDWSRGKLSLEPAQDAGLNTSVATIVGNYVSHWATGQTHVFTAGSLRGVMTASDDFARCFQHEQPAGSGQYRYYQWLAQK